MKNMVKKQYFIALLVGGFVFHCAQATFWSNLSEKASELKKWFINMAYKKKQQISEGVKKYGNLETYYGDQVSEEKVPLPYLIESTEELPQQVSFKQFVNKLRMISSDDSEYVPYLIKYGNMLSDDSILIDEKQKTILKVASSTILKASVLTTKVLKLEEEEPLSFFKDNVKTVQIRLLASVVHGGILQPWKKGTELSYGLLSDALRDCLAGEQTEKDGKKSVTSWYNTYFIKQFDDLQGEIIKLLDVVAKQVENTKKGSDDEKFIKANFTSGKVVYDMLYDLFYLSKVVAYDIPSGLKIQLKEIKNIELPKVQDINQSLNSIIHKITSIIGKPDIYSIKQDWFNTEPAVTQTCKKLTKNLTQTGKLAVGLGVGGVAALGIYCTKYGTVPMQFLNKSFDFASDSLNRVHGYFGKIH